MMRSTHATADLQNRDPIYRLAIDDIATTIATHTAGHIQRYDLNTGRLLD